MRILLTIVIMTAITLTSSAIAADLEVQISGVKSSKGQLIVCLWANETGFPICQKDAPNRRVLAAVDGAASTFKDLAPGKYAVSAFHDEDGNGKLKQNFIGIPKEPATVSGPKQKRMGPPKFDGAAIMVGDGTHISLTFE